MSEMIYRVRKNNRSGIRVIRASVTMNGVMRNFVTKMPAAPPVNTPNINPAPMPSGYAIMGERSSFNTTVVTTPANATTEPTERSIPAVRMTNVIPTAMIAVMEVPWDEVHLYGVVKAQPMGTRLGKVESLVEKPRREGAPSNLAIIGRYLLPPETFSLLEKVTPGAIGEIQLTDALTALVTKPGLFAFQFEGDRFDVGNKFGFLEANINFALKHEHLSQRTTDLIKLMAESR